MTAGDGKQAEMLGFHHHSHLQIYAENADIPFNCHRRRREVSRTFNSKSTFVCTLKDLRLDECMDNRRFLSRGSSAYASHISFAKPLAAHSPRKWTRGSAFINVERKIKISTYFDSDAFPLVKERNKSYTNVSLTFSASIIWAKQPNGTGGRWTVIKTRRRPPLNDALSAITWIQTSASYSASLCLIHYLINILSSLVKGNVL